MEFFVIPSYICSLLLFNSLSTCLERNKHVINLPVLHEEFSSYACYSFSHVRVFSLIREIPRAGFCFSNISKKKRGKNQGQNKYQMEEKPLYLQRFFLHTVQIIEIMVDLIFSHYLTN